MKQFIPSMRGTECIIKSDTKYPMTRLTSVFKRKQWQTQPGELVMISKFKS